VVPVSSATPDASAGPGADGMLSDVGHGDAVTNPVAPTPGTRSGSVPADERSVRD